MRNLATNFKGRKIHMENIERERYVGLINLPRACKLPIDFLTCAHAEKILGFNISGVLH